MKNYFSSHFHSSGISGKEKNETEERVTVKRFYGPPCNCSELGKLGYTLNGYYLVRGKEQQPLITSGNNKIEIIEGSFQQEANGKIQSKDFK